MSLPCSTISSPNKKVSLTVDSLIVRQLSIGTRNLVVLYVGVPIAENIGLKIGQTSAIALRTLQRPYKPPGLDSTALITLYCS